MLCSKYIIHYMKQKLNVYVKRETNGWYELWTTATLLVTSHGFKHKIPEKLKAAEKEKLHQVSYVRQIMLDRRNRVDGESEAQVTSLLFVMFLESQCSVYPQKL